MLRRILLGFLLLVVVTAASLALWEPLTAEAPEAPEFKPQDVRIARDKFGVPHIFGKTDADVAYGVAYAHAEDDFATLQEVLAMTRGRAGAMLGQDGAKIDFAAALLDVRATTARDWPRLPKDVRALFTAYAAGLNHYADKHPGEVRLSGLFPVTGEDVVAGFVLRSPFFFGLDSVLGQLVEGKDMHREGGPALDATGKIVPRADTPVGSDPASNGSNAMAVAPSRATDGATRLVSNSHQPWTGGVAWYELVVHSEEGWDFAGANFPGSPYPFLGHNKFLGWTNTVNRPDLIDVYKLVLNESGDQYRYDGAWRPLEEKRIWLKVKFGPFVLPVPRTVYRSVHGPVVKNDKGAFAIRYAGIDQSAMVTQYYRLNKAKDFAEWRAAMAGQGVPATNFIYADAKGNIGLFYNAMFPDRPDGFNWRGLLPGDKSAALWTKTLPFDRAPALVNPRSGYVMNANNTPWVAAGPGDELDAAAFSPLLGVEDDMTNRATRLIDLFEASGQIDEARLKAIKYDTAYAKTGYAKAWMDRLLALNVNHDPALVNAQNLLRRWDWNLDGKGKGDALALMLLRPANGSHYQRRAEPDPLQVLTETVAHLQTHFGGLDPKLGTVLRLRHGEGASRIDLPLDGGNDTVRASTLWDAEPDGRLKVRHGDSFIMFMTWGKDGRVRSESIQPFGSATTRPDSPHYNDQAPLFVRHQLKPVLFDPAVLKASGARFYRP
ncbi:MULTISPECIES: acylase [unclassified Sphingopyxis]|uniref:acylase n=1 Tax=unclassified Sphingopyxis TaxID=2614943 RepID=UPI00285D2F72|nr:MULTISPECIES: acylase [unclassified Sphingopyxis]MDR6833181.1 acyl-homoserine-lactone acylase [Sphingopyxis sp. BE122]MDR7228924.1 acyl-homoserine-lactone acylase [Sphingopyxis sp. BE259]